MYSTWQNHRRSNPDLRLLRLYGPVSAMFSSGALLSSKVLPPDLPADAATRPRSQIPALYASH